MGNAMHVCGQGLTEMSIPPSQFCYAPQSVSQFSRSVVSNSLRPHESQHTRPPCPAPTPGVHSDSRPLSP